MQKNTHAQNLRFEGRPGRTPVPLNRWGRDHWDFLAYVETRTVDHSGLIDWNHLTLSARNWPSLQAARNPYAEAGHGDSGDLYGLRVRDADGNQVIMYQHCEADALLDLADAGVIEITMPQSDEGGNYFLAPDGRQLIGDEYPSPKFVTGYVEASLMPWAKFSLTGTGREIAAKIRTHLADDGSASTFRL